MDHNKIEQGVRLILEGIGEDINREGLLETPARVARAYEEICGGLQKTPDDLFEVSFQAEAEGMVVVKDIEFYSLCEHHLLPFFGKAHICYLPGEEGRVCGLSKLARTVEVFARRPQLQERLTAQIAEAVQNGTHARGVLVLVEAEHLCMTMRGVKKPGAHTITKVARGVFKDVQAQSEALDVLMYKTR